MVAGEEPHSYASPAFDVGPGLTSGWPLATARGPVEHSTFGELWVSSTFLGAIYPSGRRRGKFLLWGKGWRGRCNRGGREGCEEQRREPRLRAAPSCFSLAHLAKLAGAVASSRKPSLMDPDSTGVEQHPKPTPSPGPVQV